MTTTMLDTRTASHLLFATSLAILSLATCSDDLPSIPEAASSTSTGGTETMADTEAGSATTADSTGPAPMAPDDCVPEPAMELPVGIHNGLGMLIGTLLLPEGCPPFDVVLIHAGSGPTDRDGNSPLLIGSNDSLKLLAEALQQRGIASVRYDKRGVAQSADATQPELDLRFEDYSTDLTLWMDAVRAQDDFGDLTLLGHSEGALIASVASSSSAPEHLISLAGAGRPAADVLREQLSQWPDGPLLDEALAIIEQLELGNTVENVSPELDPLFRPSVQPYLISWFAYDPAEVLSELTVPSLIAAGTTDIQIPVNDAALLAAARPDAQLCIIEGMNHVLKEATLDPVSQAQAYNDPSLPVVPELIDCVVGFILDEAG